MVATVSQGGSINAADYNTMQSKVAQILGTATANDGFGYGQTVTSGQVVASNYPAQPSVGDFVTAQQLDDLRTDIQKCWIHQTTAAFNLGDIAVGDWITAGAEDGTDNDTHNQYVYYTNEIETNRLPTVSLNTSQMTTNLSVRSSSLSAGWNGTKNFIFTVDFGSLTARRHFFNTGGEIRINLSHSYSGTEQKTLDWQTMITNAPDPVVCNYNTHTGLTTSYTNLYSSSGGAAVYAENVIYVRVKQNIDAWSISFEVRLEDNDTGDRPPNPPKPPYGALVDENVQGTITCSVDEFVASGSYVSVSSPTYTTNSNF